MSEPTNFELNKTPSGIDLVITDQANLTLDVGTGTFLDSHCHHQIDYCDINFRMPPPPTLYRNIRHFNRDNSSAIK